MLARARARSDAGDGEAGRELDADTRLQEYRAGAEAGGRRRGEDSYDAGRKSAPVFPELAGRRANFFQPGDSGTPTNLVVLVRGGARLHRGAPFVEFLNGKAPI